MPPKLLLFPDAADGGTATAPPDDKGTTPPPKPETKEDLSGIEALGRRMLGMPEPEPESAEAKAAREKKERDDAAEKKRKKEAAAKPKPKKPEPAPALTADQIAEASARGVALAMKKTDDEPERKPAPSTLTDQQERRLKVIEHMAKMDPDRFKDLPKQYQDFIAKEKLLADYAKDWKAKHPGQEFDPEAEEHEQFFETNEAYEPWDVPPWDTDDYVEALADIRAEKRYEEKNKETNAKLSKLERLQKLQSPETINAINGVQTTGASVYWKQYGEDFADVLKEDGTIDTAKAGELRAKDPDAFDTRWRAAIALDSEIAELYKVMNGLSDFDKNNPVHLALSNFAAQKEQELMKKPETEQVDSQGRTFLPAKDYYNSKKLSKERREADHWTFTASDLAALRAHQMASTTSKIIKQEEEKFTRMAEARGFKPSKNTENHSPEKTEEEGETAEADDGKPNSPSAGSESRKAATKKGESVETKSPLTALGNAFFGGR